MIGTLVAHCGAIHVTRKELEVIEPPAATRTWRPVGHGNMVAALEEELSKRSLTIRAESYAIQRSGAVLFGVIDLAWRQTEEFAAAIGLRTSNDKTLSIQLAVGFRIFVCDNLAFSGDLIALKRKHTAGLDLAGEIAGALDRYQEGLLTLEGDISRLKETAITDHDAKVFIFDCFEQAILPVRYFESVCSSYFPPEIIDGGSNGTHTLWSLHNVFTSHIQRLTPNRAFEANAHLGRMLGLGKAS